MEHTEHAKPISDEELRKLADMLLHGVEWYDIGPGANEPDASFKRDEYMEIWREMEQSSERFKEVCGPMLEDYWTAKAYQNAMEKVIRRLNGEFDITKIREEATHTAKQMYPFPGKTNIALKSCMYDTQARNALLQDDWEPSLQSDSAIGGYVFDIENKQVVRARDLYNSNTYSKPTTKKDK